MNILQKYEKKVYLILLIGIIIYFPIFFNGFVWDDWSFIINNPGVHTFNIFALFGPNDFNGGPFYRPLPAVYFAALYSLFEQHAFFYHLFQLTLHLIDAILLFFYFLFFFSDGIAFFLALLFLVHPINVESVAYIGSTQSELYFLPGIIALLLGHKQTLSRNRFITSIFLLFASILTKETGILFFLLFIAYRYIFKLGRLKALSLVGIGMGILYLVMRIFIGGVTYSTVEVLQLASVPLWQRLFLIPSIIIYYLKIFLFPLYLGVWQMWLVKAPTIENFYIPLLLSSIFFILLFILYFKIYKNDKKQVEVANKQAKRNAIHIAFSQERHREFLFFFLWYFLGMAILLQIVPLDMAVADRWFYFPIVGLLGMIGVILQIFVPIINRYRTYYFYGAIILLCIFSLRTFIRTFDWKDNITLYSHDIREEKDNYILLNVYAEELYTKGKISLDEYCSDEEKSVSEFATMSSTNELGDCYLKQGQYDQAIDAFARSINFFNTYHYGKEPPYDNIAYTLLLEQKPYEAINFINSKAIKVFPNSANLYTLLAIAYSQTNDRNNALTTIKKAYELSPSNSTKTVYYEIINNIPITTNPE